MTEEGGRPQACRPFRAGSSPLNFAGCADDSRFDRRSPCRIRALTSKNGKAAEMRYILNW